LRLLRDTPGMILLKHSSIYSTEPIDVAGQPEFYNAVAGLETTLSPSSLLKLVKSIESDLGRQPNAHLESRPIDIDILLYGNQVVDTVELTIPHSRLPRRAFVLVPLLEINPELAHPVTLKSLREYLVEIEPPQRVEKITDARELFRAKKN